MLWTTLMLISNIESAFNDIWHVKHPRSIFRTITDYVSLFFLLPIFLVVSSGLSIWIAALQDQLSDVIVLGPIMTFFITLSPYLLLSAGFVCLYVFMPNTKVKFSSALGPGILAGVSMQIFQMVYINSQIWISNYNAIYGSFAMIPFFLLWLQTSWIICLMGAELAYCKQNSEDFFSNDPSETSRYSFNSRFEQSWIIMEHIAQRFMDGEEEYTAEELKEMLNAEVVTDQLRKLLDSPYSRYISPYALIRAFSDYVSSLIHSSDDQTIMVMMSDIMVEGMKYIQNHIL
jgi:membrane protein